MQNARLDAEQAKATLEVANRTAEQRRRLFREGAMADRDTDTAIAAALHAQVTYKNRKKRLVIVEKVTQHTSVETTGGQLTSTRGRFESAEAQLSCAQLRSPIDLVYTDRPLFQGETASAGTPVISVMEITSLLAKLHPTKERMGGVPVLAGDVRSDTGWGHPAPGASPRP